MFFLILLIPNGPQHCWRSITDSMSLRRGFCLWHNLLWAHCPNWQTVLWVNCRSNYDPSSLKTKLLLLFHFYFSLDFDCSWWTVYFEKLVKNRSSVNHAHARARRNKRERDEKKEASRLKVCKQSCARSHTEWRPGVSICASFHMITILASSRAAVSLSLTLFQRVHNSTITSRCYTFDGCSPCTSSSVAGGGRGEKGEKIESWGGGYANTHYTRPVQTEYHSLWISPPSSWPLSTSTTSSRHDFKKRGTHKKSKAVHVTSTLPE